MSTCSLFSQSYLIPVNAPLNQYPITFTDVAQQQLVLNFTKNVTPGANISQVGWSVAGTAATITRIDAMGTNVLITLSTAITYAERLNVKVTYNAATGNFQMQDGTEPLTLTNISAVNNAYPTQADFSNGLYGENPPTDICAAVLNVEVTSNLVISHRYRNSIYFRTPRMSMLWMYPAPVPKTEPDYIETGGVGTGIFNKTNIYAAYPDNTINCTWVISIFPYIPPQAPAPGLSVTDRQVFITIPNYKKDNGTPVPGTGDLGLDPPVDDPRTLFCVGENITNFIFTDATVFDCQLPVEPNLPNTQPRNVQFVYGTQTGAGIPNVFINVNGTPVQVTDNTGVSISGVWHVNPDGTPNIPGYTTPSGFFEGPVVQYLWDSGTKLLITPMIQTYPISHTGDFVNDADGDIFDVTLRNWGPCNAYDGMDPFTYLQAVTEFSRLRLVLAPPLPTAPDVTVCLGSPTTLTAVRNGTNPGVLHWYNNSDLLPIHEVGTGATYNPGALAAGVYNYWVREIGTTGQLCEGPSKQVVLTINPIPNKPTVAVTGSLTFCFDGGITSVTLTANPNTPPAITTYQWYKNGGAIGGAVTNAITLNDPSQNGDYTVRTFGINPTNCPSPLSDPLTVIIYSISNIVNPVPQSICELGSTTFTVSSSDAISNYSWEYSTDGGATWGNVNNGVNFNGAGGQTLQVINAPLSFNGYQFRGQLKTVAGGCWFKSGPALLTVSPVPTANAGAAISRCNATPLGAITMTGATAGGTYSAVTWSGGGGSGSWTQNANPANATFTPTVSSGSFTATLTVTGSGTCVGTNPTSTRTISWSQTPVPTAGADISRCSATGTTFIAMTGATATGTFTADVWSGGGALGNWTQNANPALARFTPTTISGSFTATLTLTGGGACTGTNPTSTRTVSWSQTPVATAGGNITRCDNTPLAVITMTGATATGTYSAQAWSGGGALGTWAQNANPALATFTPTATSGSFTATLTLTGSGACLGTNSTSTRTITWGQTPTANAGADITRCNGTPLAAIAMTGAVAGGSYSAVTWSGGGGLGNWAQNAVAANATFTPTTTSGSFTAILTVTGKDGCAGTNPTASRVITWGQTPTAGAGANISRCDATPFAAIAMTGATATGSYSAATWTGGGALGTWIQDINPAVATFTPTVASGTFTATLTVTGSAGCLGTNPTATRTITWGQTPVPNAGGAINRCDATPTAAIAMTGATATGTFSAANWSGGGAQGSWTQNANPALATFTPTVNVGSFTATLTLTGSGSCTGTNPTSTRTINWGFLPTVSAGPDQSICALASATLAGSIGGGATTATWSGGGGGYAPNNTTLNAVYTPSAAERLAGTVTLILTTNDPAGPCGPVNDNVKITIGAPLTAATLTGSGNACFGATSTISSVITGGAPPYTVNYSINGVAQAPMPPYTSGTDFSLGILPAGTYNIQITSVTDPCGNTVPPAGLPAVYTININGIPSAAATMNNTPSICNNGTTDIVFHADVANSDFIYTVSNAPAVTWVVGKAPVAGTRINGENISLAQNLQHTSTFPTTVTYTITPRGPGATACLGAPITRDVIVNPTAVITSAATATVCDNTPLGYTATSSTVGATFAWTRAVVVGISNPIGNGATSSINESLDNTTIAPVVVRYVITPSYGGCPGTPFNLDVTVKPTAIITSAATKTICDNASTAYTATSSTVGATFAWTRAVVAGISNPIGSGATSAINENLDNTTIAPVVVRYVITPGYGGCAGTPFNLDVTVNPTAIITSAATATVCNNTPVGYTATSSTVGATFAWTRAVVVGISNPIGSGATSSINESLDNTTIAPVVVRYVITPSYGGCPGTPFNLDVTVNPTAVITSAATKTICDNALTAYTATSSTVGATFAWTRAVVAGISNPIGSGATSAINENLDNTTIAPVVVRYVITPSYAGCAGTPFNLDVTVNPTAIITSAATATVCDNTPVGYTATSSTVGATFAWTRAVVVGISNPIGSGATSSINESLDNTTIAPVVVRYVITPGYGGCPGTPFNLDVTVNPTAVITSAATATVCNNTPVGYTATSSTVGATFAWTRAVVVGISNPIGSGATSSINESLDNTTIAPVVVRYVITPGYGGCPGTPFNFDVTVNPTAVITSAATKTICDNASTGYTATSSTVGATFAWTRAVVAGISNPIGSGATSAINENLDNTTTAPVDAVYIITPGYAGCAGTPFTLTVTVNPAGQVDQPADQVLCDGSSSTTVTFGTANTGGATTYAWTNSVPGIGLSAAGNGNIGVFNATNAGTAPLVASIVVTPTFTNNGVGCAGPTKTFTITVNPTPVLSTTLTPSDVCSNGIFSYAPASATAGTTFNWTRAAIAGITPAGPTFGVDNPNETLVNITSAPIAVTYQYTLEANSCPNVQDVVVNIDPEPVITVGQNPSACSGNALNYRILMNNFTNPADNVTFTWGVPVLNPVDPGFTGGTARAVPSAANITDTYLNTTGVLGTATYTVTPVKNGCSGTPVTVVITVGSQPVLDPGLNAFACSNSPIGLLLKVAAGSVVPTYYNIISKTVSAGLTEAGNAAVPNGTAPDNYLSADKYVNVTGVDKTVTYRVQPILAPDCIGAPVDVVITIRPQPVIFPAQTITVCSRTTIGKEILLSPPNTPAGTLFNWPVPVISDASVQGTAGVNVVADPAGTPHINDQIYNYSAAPIQATYTVTPVSQFGCAGTATPVIITIDPEPVPQPISGRDKICVTDKNVVYNVSAVGGSTFHWTVDAAVGTKTFDFNANAILIDAAAVPGSGNITVYETNSYSCSGAVSTLPVQVYSQPAAEIITGNAVVCANSTEVYSVTNRAGSVYSWTVPGGAAIIGDPSASSITIIFANVGRHHFSTRDQCCRLHNKPYSESCYSQSSADSNDKRRRNNMRRRFKEPYS